MALGPRSWDVSQSLQLEGSIVATWAGPYLVAEEAGTQRSPWSPKWSALRPGWNGSPGTLQQGLCWVERGIFLNEVTHPQMGLEGPVALPLASSCRRA